MRGHLRSIAEEAASMLERPSARVLDIGCNDGTLLKVYPEYFEKYGVDPSDVAQEVGDGITVIQDLFPSGELLKRLDGRQCQIITSIAMF